MGNVGCAPVENAEIPANSFGRHMREVLENWVYSRVQLHREEHVPHRV